MAGNGRFELSSANPDPRSARNYPNGQRGNYSGLNLDRSGSYRESNVGQMFGSGKDAPRGSGTLTGDMPPLSQCLMLEPILIGNQKYSRSGELRRALGFAVGSSSEDNSFGAAHLKASPPAAMEELKRFRAGVADNCIKASGRAKKLDERLHKLNKYFDAMTTKKQVQNELVSNERSALSNLKMGTQIYRSPSDLVSPKFEDRPKNVMLNKRVRTSVAETRAEFRNNGLPRQPLVTKDRDMLKDNNAEPDVAEGKIRGLPVGGESWEKKMKKKRSVGAVYLRPCDGDAEPKRTVHHSKLTSEAGLQSCDSQGLRPGTSSGASGMNKSDGASSPAGSNARAALKSEEEKSVLSRDIAPGLNKERCLPKASIKLNIREENHSICPSLVTKGKASRAPRSGSTTTTNTISNISRVSGTLESWDLLPSANRNPSVVGANNRKRPIPTGPSSPPITQWVGQRPQKISRTRRTNIVSPVSNHVEVQLSSEGCLSSDVGARLTTGGANGSLLSKSAATGTQISKVKPESVSSPARLSESEESGAVETRFKEKLKGSNEVEEKAINNVQNVGPSAILAKKNKFLIKGENADGVRRQGRSARVTSVSRTSISPIREKLDNAMANKPLRSARHGSDKNGSKSGRPLKKLSDRKGFSRLGPASGGSPDFTGESDDDREELTSAANLAYNSNLLACSSTFWKKVEALFASISSEEKSYISEQLKLADECHDSLSPMFHKGNDSRGDHMLEEISVSDSLSGERNRHMRNELGRKDLASKVELVDQFQTSILLAGVDSGRIFDKITPLYQRVLSALIIEDDPEEFEENGVGGCVSNQNNLWSSPDETHYDVDSERKFRDRLECECESTLCLQVQKNGTTSRFLSCNGYGTYSRSPNVPDPPCSGELLRGDSGDVHSNVGVLVGPSQSDSDGPQSLQKNSGCISSYDSQYEQMQFEDKLLLELQSVGLYPETVPDLHDKEDEVINQEIVQLQQELYQQTGRKKMGLDKIHKAIQEGQDTDGRDLEHVAVNRLVELAYKKLLATRGNLAIKNGIPKVSKQVALAFAKRTLTRCRKFEESGVSCFNEPALRDIISAVPPCIYEEDPLTNACVTVANGSFSGISDTGPLDGFEPFSPQADQAFAKNGPISNRGKKKEVLLDDVVGGAAFRSYPGSSLLGGAKGKRSERDRDKDTSIRNGVAKAGRSLGNSKGERKMKTKHKQKTAQLSTSGSGYVKKFVDTTHPVYPSASGSAELINNNGNRRREVGLVSSGNVPPDSLKDVKESVDFANLPLNDIDTIDELGVDNLLDFDVDALEDHDFVGLDIPMDDLSELNMFRS